MTPQPFNPITFLILNKTRLFTAQDVCEIVDHYCTHSNASERDKVLDLFEKIPTYPSDLGDMVLLSDIEAELRTTIPEVHR